MSGASVELRGATLRYGERAALAPLDLDVPAGARFAVIGRSGAGKTSLLRLIAGLAAPDAGEVRLDGALASEPGRVTLAPEARGVGLVFQQLALWPHLGVEGTLAFVAPGTRHERRDAARRWAERVGLGDRLDARPAELSGGEQQRLALARALLPAPRVLLLDEPFAHLDPTLRAELATDLVELAGETTLLLVTHQRREVLELAEQVAVLDAGRLLERGPLAEMLKRPSRRATATLLGLGNVIAGARGDDGLATPLGLLAVEGEGDAALVRPEQLRLTDDEDGVPGEVLRCVAARPDQLERAFDALVAVDSLVVRVALASPLASGARVQLSVDGAPFPALA